MYSKRKVIYYINVEDLQNVAEQELDRKLTDKEIDLIGEKLGDHIGWYEAILETINDVIVVEQEKE
jgi:hypothetical protein